MAKLTARELRKHLEARPHAELVDDLVRLFAKLDGVKEYYAARLGLGPNQELLEKHKAAVRKEFFPARGYGDARLSVARKAVNDYKKVSNHLPGLIDLMLFYVEMGVRFTNTYGDIDEPFYNSMESMYASALKQIAANGLYDAFRDRCYQVVEDTSEIGWGFHDELSNLYAEVFGDP